jgi:hypothetical protein
MVQCTVRVWLWRALCDNEHCEASGATRASGEARELFAPVYRWFTEGFDTRDLREAKA